MQQLVLPPSGDAVKLIDQYPLYELATALAQVKELPNREGATAYDQLVALFNASRQLNSLLEGNPVEVSYCRESVERIRGHLRELIDQFRDKESGALNPANSARLEGWEFSRIMPVVEMFEHQFSAELKKMAVYAVPRRGIFDTERLVSGAEAHLPESVRQSVPEFVLNEFRHAGRCLAFGLFSASAFHSLRAAEKALRQYYAAFLGEPKKDEITMGLMSSHLKDRLDQEGTSKPKPNAATIRTIADIVNFDRNPLTHKELDLTEDDAAILFNRAQAMISLMARELIDRTNELHPDLPFADGAKPSNAMADARAVSRGKKSTS